MVTLQINKTVSKYNLLQVMSGAWWVINTCYLQTLGCETLSSFEYGCLYQSLHEASARKA